MDRIVRQRCSAQPCTSRPSARSATCRSPARTRRPPRGGFGMRRAGGAFVSRRSLCGFRLLAMRVRGPSPGSVCCASTASCIVPVVRAGRSPIRRHKLKRWHRRCACRAARSGVEKHLSRHCPVRARRGACASAATRYVPSRQTPDGRRFRADADRRPTHGRRHARGWGCTSTLFPRCRRDFAAGTRSRFPARPAPSAPTCRTTGASDITSPAIVR